jgi:hypothetical protein
MVLEHLLLVVAGYLKVVAPQLVFFNSFGWLVSRLDELERRPTDD